MDNRKAVADYYLRGIPADLWKKVKTRAAHEDRPVRAVLLALLKAYAQHGTDHPPKERK